MIKVKSIEEYFELTKDNKIDFYLYVEHEFQKGYKDFLYLSPTYFKRLKRNHKTDGDQLANVFSSPIYYIKN